MDPYPNSSVNYQAHPFNDFHSVEVAMEKLPLTYQFKLWRSDHNSLFLLIKENSKILSQLKAGNILPLKYYSSNALSHSEVKRTQIEKIIDEKQGRFKGHHRVELTIITNDADFSAN